MLWRLELTRLELRITRVVEAGTRSQQWGGWYGASQISQMSNESLDATPGRGEGGDAVMPGKIEVWADATIVFGAGAKE